MWKCKVCGGKVGVQLIQKFKISKDRKVIIPGLLGNKVTFKKIVCEEGCASVGNMELIHKIAEWVE